MSKEVKIELIVDSGEAQKNIQDVNAGLDKTDKNLKQTNKTAKKGKKGFISLAGGARVLGAALKAAGIGLVISAIAGLSSAMSNNQKVMDTLSLATGTVTQFFTDLVAAVTDAFTATEDFTSQFDALGRIVGAFVTGVGANFSTTFQAIRGSVLGAQLAFEKSFFGGNDADKIKELESGLIDVNLKLVENARTVLDSTKTIVKSIPEAVGEVVNITTTAADAVTKVSIKSAFETTKNLQQLTKEAELAKVKNQGLIEEFDRLAEKQRQIRDDDRKGINERIEANEKLLEHLEDQKEKMLENAKAMKAQAQAQFDANKSDANNIKLQEAKNELKAIEAQIEGFMSEQKSNAVALEKELNELEISGLQNKAELQKAERDFKAEMIQDDVKRTQMLIDNLAIEKELDRERLQSKIDSFQAGTQAQQDAQQELDLFLAESARTEKKLKADLVKFTDAADKKSADNEKKLQKQKVENIRGALSDIASIVGANSKFGKAIAIVQAIQDTFAGANKALAQGGIFGFIGAASVIAAGLANVKTITSTKSPKPPASLGARDTGESAPAIPAAATASLPPQFDTVGASGINQLADVLGNQAPPRAFVVSGDVSTAQELDRNIISSASIG
jgi:hypothetical protein|tara:strand:+ start:1574 stop:3430 length:1857 start_codon:yes stop_codon:yes gene_type:complete